MLSSIPRPWGRPQGTGAAQLSNGSPFGSWSSESLTSYKVAQAGLTIKSPDPHVYPSIRPDYLSTTVDQETAVTAMRMSRALASSKAMSPFIVAERVPGKAAETDEEMLDAARTISQTIYHPTSTCKMGSDAGAVVDDRLRVHGVKGLRIADASIMPTIVSGNTNAPTIMIGEKASDMILEDQKSH